MLSEVNINWFVIICPNCNCENAQSIGIGGVKLGNSPYNIPVDGTLIVAVDGGDPVTVTFQAEDFPDITNVTPAQLCTKLNACIPGATAIEDDDDVLLESNLIGMNSCISIQGGTTLDLFGIYINDYRPVVLGVPAPPGSNFPHAYDLIRVRNCCCGNISFVQRTFDVMPEELHGTFGYIHRCAVNTLAEYLKENGYVEPQLADYYATETKTSTDKFDTLEEAIAIDPSLFPPIYRR